MLAEGRGEALELHVHEEAPAPSETRRPLLRRGPCKRPTTARKEWPQCRPAAVSKTACAAYEAPITAELAGQLEVEPQGLTLVPQRGRPLQALIVQPVALPPEGDRENAGHRRAVVRQRQPIRKNLLRRRMSPCLRRAAERSAQGRQPPPEPLLCRSAMGGRCRRQQRRQDICLWMGEVRAVNRRYTVALGDCQSSGLHGFQFAVCRGEAHAASARECADTPADSVGPEPAKKLPTRAARHQVVEHRTSLSD